MYDRCCLDNKTQAGHKNNLSIFITNILFHKYRHSYILLFSYVVKQQASILSFKPRMYDLFVVLNEF